MAAAGILDKAKSDPVVQLIANSRSEQMATTARVFCAAYKEAKCHRPTNGLGYVIDCQELNGVYMHSSVAHANIQKQYLGKRNGNKSVQKNGTVCAQAQSDAGWISQFKHKEFLIYLRVQLTDTDKPTNVLQIFLNW